MSEPTSSHATWPLSLPEDLSRHQVRRLSDEIGELAERSPWGWGHTVDFGPFIQRGILGERFIQLAQWLDEHGWWPKQLSGLRIADIGCFSGGMTALLAARGADELVAVDEIPEHVEQCTLVVSAFDLENVKVLEETIYNLSVRNLGAFDIIYLGGVLYHLSDMLSALMSLRELLAEDGTLIMETNAVPEFEDSYANFGRFVSGMWWQPSAACISDMCTFAGLTSPEIYFVQQNRCLVRTRPGPSGPKFRRGTPLGRTDIYDKANRPLGSARLAPKTARGA